MKNTALAVIFIILAGMFVSCAEQLTVREQEMKKYEQIDTSVVQGMPDAIKRVVDAYNNGDYQTAAIGFYAVMKNSEWARLHETARYYYAESLFRMGLYQSAEYQLAEILFEGPDSHYFVSALLKLLAVTYETKDERVLFAVLSNVDYNSLPKKFANELMYYLGKINFYKGQDEEALKFFTQVKDYSSFYPLATYYMGVIQVRQRMYAEAMQSYQKIMEMPDDMYVGADIKQLKGMAELALGELYYAAGFDEKTKNKLAMFNVALNYFTNVDRRNPQWFESLFARTWASLMISRFDATLGTVVTLGSPFFTDIYFPDVSVVEAVTFYNLCRYQEVNEVIDKFFLVYPDYRQRLQSWLENVSTKTGLDVYKELLSMYRDSVAGKPTPLPEAILRSVLTDQKFQRDYIHIKEVEREIEIIEGGSDSFKKSVIADDLTKKMTYQLTTLRNDSGKMLVKKLQEVAQDLTQIIADMKAIRFEMTDKLKSTYEKEELFGKKTKGGALKEETAYSPAVPSRAYYWPFDGEYWEDELGYYFYNIPSACVDE
jgi:tetratricopeptide (TPR) repeat protein